MKNYFDFIFHAKRQFAIVVLLLFVNNVTFGDNIRDPDQNKTITMNLGESITLEPRNDYDKTKSPSAGVLFYRGSYELSNKDAFSITTKANKVDYKECSTCTWKDGYYYNYTLKALKAGTYTFKACILYYTDPLNTTGAWSYSFDIHTVYIIYTITVVVPVTSVTLNKTKAEIGVGESLQLTATVKPSNATNKNLSWKSSDTNVATVSSSGLVKGIKAGSCTITATSKDGTKKSATCALTVKNIMITSVTLNKSSAQMYIGDNLQLTATVSPSNATNKELSWSSSNSSVASVNSSTGLVTAKKAGTCTIKASTKDGSGKYATCTVTVNNILVSDITLNKTTATLLVGNSLKLTATITPSNATNKNLEWSSSDNNVASVSSTGLVTGRHDGNCTITAKAKDGSGKYATCEVTVKSVSISSISLSYTMANTYVGKSIQLTPTITPSNATNKKLTWTSSDNTIASVDNNGVVTGIKVGRCEIKVTTNDGSSASAQCTINVTFNSPNDKGDINNDGDISLADILLLVDAILNSSSQYYDTDIYDINGDKEISLIDVLMLIDKILNYEEEDEEDGENIFKERVVNGNCEGDDVSCFKTNANKVRFYEDPTNAGNHCIAMKLQQDDLPEWDTFYITVSDKLEVGDKYRIKFRVRADKATSATTLALNNPKDYNWWSMIDGFSITENWQTIEKEGIVTSEQVFRDEDPATSDRELHTIGINIYRLSECENTCYFDDISWKVKKQWYNYVKNGDITTDNVTCFIGRDGIDGTDYPARIVKFEDGTRAFNVTSIAPTIDSQTGEEQQIDNWRTQFFITTPHVLRANEKYKFVMEARAEKDATISSGIHRSAGDYLSGAFGNFDLTSNWKKIEVEGTVTDKQAGGYTIAFSCNLLKELNNYYFRNIELYINDYNVKE